MNRADFYSYLRRRDVPLFGTSLSKKQVVAIDALLDAGEGLPLDHMAHVLAEIHHETGGGMYPVKETVFPHSKNQNPTDAEVIRRLDAAFAKGRLPWVKAPYWRDGWFGRGGIQVTHKNNYAKASAVSNVDLVSHPEKLLDPVVSAIVAVEGCRHGIFTGKRLSDFDGVQFDHYNARAIVNGDKKANGQKIAVNAGLFANALYSAGWGEKRPAQAQVVPDAVSGGINSQSLWTRLFAAILGILRGK